MSRNESNTDRIIRFVLGLVLLGITFASGLWLVALPAVILLGTAAVGFCPLYRIVGINTCPVELRK
ncbi:MAG: DUF2892 domain-containing protein [Anaerolineae bacterium]